MITIAQRCCTQKSWQQLASRAVWICLCLLFSFVTVAHANMHINFVVVNASPDEPREVPITYYLPRESDAEDIIDTGMLKLDYDIDKAAHYVSGAIELNPKESKTLRITVRDVWKISPVEIDMLKLQINDHLKLLEGTQYYDAGVLLRDEMFRKMDYIITQQNRFVDNVERRIEEYRAHAATLEEIRKNAYSIDYLKIPPPAMYSEAHTVTFVVEVANAAGAEKDIEQKHYLPNEIRSSDVVDSQGFEVRFDDTRQQCFLAKTETFGPGETKRYSIVIKDIWRFDAESTLQLTKRANDVFTEIQGSEYEAGAQHLVDSIARKVELIHASIANRSDMKNYISTFRANMTRYDDALIDIDRLEKMLSLVKAKRLEEFEKSRVTNVLQKIQALRGVMALSEAIFGKRLSMTMTWRIIWGILIFVAFFTTIHFFSWLRRSRIMGEEIAVQSGGGGVITEVTPSGTEEEGSEKA